MNILVTGAAGFIASHIIEQLLITTNQSVIGIDNFYSGTKSNISIINSIDKEKKFTFIEADIRDKDALKKIIQNFI